MDHVLRVIMDYICLYSIHNKQWKIYGQNELQTISLIILAFEIITCVFFSCYDIIFPDRKVANTIKYPFRGTIKLFVSTQK